MLPMPGEVEAHVRPEWFSDRDPLRIEVTGAAHLSSRPVVAVLMDLNSVDTHWVIQIPIDLDELGNGATTLADGLELGHEASVYVHALIDSQAEDGPVEHRFPNVHMSIANPTVPIASLGDVLTSHQRIVAAQAATYGAPLGDSAAPGAIEHRAMSLVEGLYMTTTLRLPGIQIDPVPAAPAGAEMQKIVNDTLETMGWACRVQEDQWAALAQARDPLTRIVCNQVWARSFEEAGELARDARDRVIALMAVNRGATGRPVCLIIEQRQPDDAVASKWASEEPHYTGNLAGGFVSGEDQSALLTQYRAVESDPLLKLCCDLFGEALHERSVDARFLRFWSILEVISAARLPSNAQVTLRNGDPWPNQAANTTKNALPRVYAYIAGLIDRQNVDEASHVDPATDLYDAVRVWYARRNATGHSGRLVAGDAVQQGANWYAHAMRSLAPDETAWSSGLQRIVNFCLQSELHALGHPSP